jgi:hypothetical protein
MTETRDLIQRLTDALINAVRIIYNEDGTQDISTAALVLTEALMYLTRPAPDGPAVPDGREPASVTYQPTDQELLELMPETMRDEFSYAARTCSDAMGGRVKPGIFRVALNTAALEYARAVLERYTKS